ncbi:MAG: hypothetical protein RUMPE_00942 [Eubacteriales bacterium SKADARSKE-1]|nr:hypothetical protein [Eubacteriales bacterium SKADARSKE-1]
MDTMPNIMKDRNLNIKSKAIYAYLCGLSGRNNMCYPSRGKIAYDLNLNYHTPTRYLKELEDLGYIQIQRTRANGKFNNNLYTLNKKEVEKYKPSTAA